MGGGPCRPGPLPGLPLQQDPERDALRTPASEQLDSEVKVDFRLPGESTYGAIAVACPAELFLPPAHYLVPFGLAEPMPCRRCHRVLPRSRWLCFAVSSPRAQRAWADRPIFPTHLEQRRTTTEMWVSFSLVTTCHKGRSGGPTGRPYRWTPERTPRGRQLAAAAVFFVLRAGFGAAFLAGAARQADARLRGTHTGTAAGVGSAATAPV